MNTNKQIADLLRSIVKANKHITINQIIDMLDVKTNIETNSSPLTVGDIKPSK